MDPFEHSLEISVDTSSFDSAPSLTHLSSVDAGGTVEEATSLLKRFCIHNALRRRLNQILTSEGWFATGNLSLSEFIRIDGSQAWPRVVFRVNRESVAQRFMHLGSPYPSDEVLDHKQGALLQLVTDGIAWEGQREVALSKLPVSAPDKGTSVTTVKDLTALRTDVRQALQNGQAVAITLAPGGWNWQSKDFIEGEERWAEHGFELAVGINVRDPVQIDFGALGRAHPGSFYESWLPSIEDALSRTIEILERGSYPRVFARPLGPSCYELGALNFACLARLEAV